MVGVSFSLALYFAYLTFRCGCDVVSGCVSAQQHRQMHYTQIHLSIARDAIYSTCLPLQEGAMKGLNLSSVCEIEATIQGESKCSRIFQTVVKGPQLPRRRRRPITFINGSQMVGQSCLLPHCESHRNTSLSIMLLYNPRVSPPTSALSERSQMDLPTVSTQKKDNKTGKPISFDYNLVDHHVYKRSSGSGRCVRVGVFGACTLFEGRDWSCRKRVRERINQYTITQQTHTNTKIQSHRVCCADLGRSRLFCFVSQSCISESFMADSVTRATAATAFTMARTTRYICASPTTHKKCSSFHSPRAEKERYRYTGGAGDWCCSGHFFVQIMALKPTNPW